ncbi:MAG: 2-C-methyl-D-erythritol 4-phosphate cytidylyltransferase, partial [Phycisphaerales bacterium]|nr:2-C-methyl-D-erythritol 4-phosphate cytidylyltransferase [Phycisphaerales bacterium]
STDDAGLVERLGERVVVVTGEVSNLKITRPSDLRLARNVLNMKGPSERPTHKKF